MPDIRHIRLEGAFPKGSELVGQHIKVIDAATDAEILDVDSLTVSVGLIGPMKAILVILDPEYVGDTDGDGQLVEEVIVDSVNVQPKG